MEVIAVKRIWFEQAMVEGLRDMIKELAKWQGSFTVPTLEKTMRDEGKAFVVEVRVPGWSQRHSIDVRVEKNRLWITGAFIDKTPAGSVEHTTFTMNQWLPAPVDPTKLKTDIQSHGRLTVTLPKRKPRHGE
jgi:HSP20 family molecular chaperone IbpA